MWLRRKKRRTKQNVPIQKKIKMGKQVGPTPITAKITKTTKGGITQPELKNLQSPAKITNIINPKTITNITGRLLSGMSEGAVHMSRSKDNAVSRGASAAFGFAKGFLKGPKAPSAPPTPKTPSPSSPKKGSYEYAKSQNANLDSIISRRNKAAKGTAEYNRYQNQINKAYGVGPTNRNTTVKTASQSLKPKKINVNTKLSASTEIKPVSQTKKSPQVSSKTTKQVSRISDRSSKTREKGKAALEAGNLQKARRLKKRESRLDKRAERKITRSTKQAERKQQRKQRQSASKKPGSTFRNLKR